MKLFIVIHSDFSTKEIFTFNKEEFSELKFCYMSKSFSIKFGKTEIIGYCGNLNMRELERFLVDDNDEVILELVTYTQRKWLLMKSQEENKEKSDHEKAIKQEKACSTSMPS